MIEHVGNEWSRSCDLDLPIFTLFGSRRPPIYRNVSSPVISSRNPGPFGCDEMGQLHKHFWHRKIFLRKQELSAFPGNKHWRFSGFSTTRDRFSWWIILNWWIHPVGQKIQKSCWYFCDIHQNQPCLLQKMSISCCWSQSAGNPGTPPFQ